MNPEEEWAYTEEHVRGPLIIGGVTPAMIEAGAEEVRGVVSQLYTGKLSVQEIQPRSLAEDVLRAALSVPVASPRKGAK